MAVNDVNRRITILVVGMLLATSVVLYRLVMFQLVDWQELSDTGLNELIWPYEVQPDRGFILDRNGKTLAAPGSDYSVGIDIVQLYGIKDFAEDGDNKFNSVITELALALDIPRSEIADRVAQANENANIAYVLLDYRIPPELKEEIEATFEELDLYSVKFDPVARRQYPNGEFMCHVLGYVDFDGTGQNGIEAHYEHLLGGQAAFNQGSVVPHEGSATDDVRDGRHLYLTIERNLQYLVEQHLQDAIETYQAESGSITVMDPRTGAVLAMANAPCYNPFTYHEAAKIDNGKRLANQSVSTHYEPGSVMKLMTVAAAIDSGNVAPSSTYYDSGEHVIGGHPVWNAEREVYGTVDIANILVNSINTGTAWMAGLMGPDTFYTYVERFGFGAKTGIDLAYETPGLVSRPGDENWTEASLGTNAFGQGINTTPIQVLSMASAIANNGTIMRPYILDKVYDGEVMIEENEPLPISQPISAETAQIVNAMAIKTAANYTEMPGYTIAGKTGTAQILEGGIYHESNVIASFVGWLPADDPQLIMLVKLDKPKVGEWGSDTALPTWVTLAQELVVQLDIPPDIVRWANK